MFKMKSPFLKTYDILYFLIFPISKFYRNLNTTEKYGFPLKPKPKNKKIVWFHGASMGESLCGLVVLKAIAKKYPNIFFVFTTCTETSGKILRENLPENAYYQPVPWDYSRYVNRFLNHWTPSIAFFIEADYWPNLILQTANQKIPMVLLNGRVSEKSLKRWGLLLGLFKRMIGSFAYIFPQNLKNLEIFQKLGSNNIAYLGNLKYSSPPLAYNLTQLKSLKQMCKNRILWCAASTREGEEAIVAYTHRVLKNKVDNLLTILIPRHPERREKIIENLKKEKLKVAIRSKGEEVQKDTDIYLVDTIGEMGLFYELSPIVFVGGTLVPIGGHNPLEPAHFKCAIMAGPHTFNNKQIFDEMTDGKAIETIRNKDEMVKTLDLLLTNTAKRSELSQNAYDLVHHHSKTVDKILENIEPLLNEVLK